jgi:sulfate permease, SulP family
VTAGTTAGYPQQQHTGAARLFPLLGWLRGYRRATLRHDLIAGLTVAVMLVPQSMAYASLAGLPPVVGLYASVVPLIAYALLGTSGSLAVGPVAITALMTGAALGPLAAGDPGRYAALAAVLALMVGAIHLILAVARLGSLVSFISHPVLIGFTSAAAIIIAASQVKDLFGLRADGGQTLPETLTGLFRADSGVHGITIAVAAVSLAALLLLRRYAPKLPGALLVVAGVTAVSAAFALGDRGVRILTEVPAGLPLPALPQLDPSDLLALLPAAVAIALVAYLEGIAVAKALAGRARQRVHAGRELAAVGAANVSAGLFQAFPVAGGFSRSAVNFAAGARTPVSTLITAAVVALTVVLLTPAFYHLPYAVLASIVVIAVLGLVDGTGARAVWRTRRADGLVAVVTFLATLLVGVEPGLAAGIGFSLVLLAVRTVRQRRASRDAVPAAVSAVTGEVVVVRVDRPVYFPVATKVGDQLTQAVDDRPHLRAVVLDASAISDADVDGVHAIGHARERLAERGVALHLAGVRAPVREMLRRGGVWQPLERVGRVHPDVAGAVARYAEPVPVR